MIFRVEVAEFPAPGCAEKPEGPLSRSSRNIPAPGSKDCQSLVVPKKDLPA